MCHKSKVDGWAADTGGMTSHDDTNYDPVAMRIEHVWLQVEHALAEEAVGAATSLLDACLWEARADGLQRRMLELEASETIDLRDGGGA